MPPALSYRLQDDIKSALSSNRTAVDIAAEFKVHPSTVRKYARKFWANLSPSKRGRPTIVSDTTKEYIKIQIISGHLLTVREIHQKLLGFSYKLSYVSAVNVLKSTGFHRHRNWTVDQWRQVIFSDETKINIWGSDGVKYYWKRKDDVLRSHHLDLTVKHGGGKLIMWRCITAKGSEYGCQIYDDIMDFKIYQHILGTTYTETLGYYGFDKRQVYL
ncbi:hypothetical protein RMATCC62417_03133 [Rhizopus microsporus]|nr:hypothetical protein RMATCC62417_03133 [Rhizopus microsporus]